MQVLRVCARPRNPCSPHLIGIHLVTATASLEPRRVDSKAQCRTISWCDSRLRSRPGPLRAMPRASETAARHSGGWAAFPLARCRCVALRIATEKKNGHRLAATARWTAGAEAGTPSALPCSLAQRPRTAKRSLMRRAVTRPDSRACREHRCALRRWAPSAWRRAHASGRRPHASREQLWDMYVAPGCPEPLGVSCGSYVQRRSDNLKSPKTPRRTF